jgi:peroxiredoxin
MTPKDFELKDADDQTYRFDANQRTEKNPLLVFYRGHW